LTALSATCSDENDHPWMDIRIVLAGDQPLTEPESHA
jgi:hypothetical protein